MAKDVPESIVNRLHDLFEDEQMRDALSALPRKREDQTDGQYVRILSAVVSLSEGNLNRLRYFADRALQAPEDLGWLEAMPETDEGFPRLAEALLRGGPVTIRERGPARRSASPDLWLRGNLMVPFVCIVCMEEVLPQEVQVVYLQRVDAHDRHSDKHEVMAMVHRHCLEQGRQLAEQQRYGWSESQGGWPPGKE